MSPFWVSSGARSIDHRVDPHGAERDDRGATLVEYTFLVGLVAVVCIAALVLIGAHVGQNLSNAVQGFH